jgi:hypothetical protein
VIEGIEEDLTAEIDEGFSGRKRRRMDGDE